MISWYSRPYGDKELNYSSQARIRDLELFLKSRSVGIERNETKLTPFDLDDTIDLGDTEEYDEQEIAEGRIVGYRYPLD